MWRITIALSVITHTIAPVNLHSSPKVRRSAPVHPTKTTFAKRHVPLELNVMLGHAHFEGRLFVRFTRHFQYKAAYQI